MTEYEQWKKDYAERMKGYDYGPRGEQIVSGFLNSSASDSMANSQVYSQSDPTKAESIMQAAGKPIGAAVEIAQKNPLLGWGVNLALNTAQWIGQNVIDPVVRIATTADLLLTDMPSVSKRANALGMSNVDYAFQEAENISLGQAVWSGMTPGGDIFDEEKRKEFFEDNWLGLIMSGSTDLVLNMAGSKGTGVAWRGAGTQLFGTNVIKNVDEFAGKMDDIVNKLDNLPPETVTPLSSTAQFLKDAVETNDIAALRANPFVASSANPDRIATLLSKVNTNRAAADIILADRGHLPALNNLRDSLPLAHDALSDFGYDMSKPLTDWSEIHKLPEDASQYKKLIEALKESDKVFAGQLDSFVNDMSSGRFSTNWQPSRFAIIDKARLVPQRFKDAALIGDWSYLSASKTGISVTERQGDRYTRGIRFFQKIQGVRSQGHINVSNPRTGEAIDEVLSELNRVNFLRDNVDFKESAVKIYTRAVDDIERAKAIGQIEQLTLIEMAKHYNIGGIRTISEAGGSINDQVRYLREVLHNDIDVRRGDASKFLNDNGFVLDGTDGSINFFRDFKIQPKENLVSRSTEAQVVPMLDFRRLEARIITELDSLNKAHTGSVERFNVGPKDVALAKLHNSDIVMGLTQFADSANMLFSNLHLLRAAFIPKNSMLDPFMRASMVLERFSGFSNGGAGVIAKAAYNNTRRRAYSIPAKTVKAKWSREARALDGDLKDAKVAYGTVKKNLDDAEKSVRKTEARVAKLTDERKAIVGDTADDVAARQLLDDKIVEQNQRLVDLRTESAVARDAVDTVADARRIIMTKKANMLSNLRDERAAIDYLGKEEFVHITKDGERIAIRGAFDPNAKGASAFRAETDSYANAYSAQGSSELSLRLRSNRTWNEINPDTSNKEAMADYWEALSHIANRQVRNELDEVLGKVMRGEGNDEIVAWLRGTPSGREYANRIKSRITEDNVLLDEDIYGWLEHTQRKLYEMFPSQELREIILKRNVKADEIKAYLEGYEGNLPAIYGPTSRSAFKSASLGQKIAYGAELPAQFGWRLISGVEDKLVRMPLFRDYWKQEMQSLIKYAEAKGTAVTYDLMNDAFRQQAYRRALVRVEQTLYSSRRSTNGMYAARYMMAFPAAYFNSQKVALKAMMRNPYNAYWYNSVQQLMDANNPLWGAYYEDTSTGETYEKLKDVPEGVDVSVKINLPTGVENFLKEKGFDAYLDPNLGGMRIPQKQLEFMVGDPSLSWVGSATLSEVIKRADLEVPVFGRITGERLVEGIKSTFGEDFYKNQLIFQGNLAEGGNLLETLANQTIPVTYKQLFLSVFGSAADARLADEANRLYRMEYRDWMAGGQNPQDKPDYDATVQKAKTVLAVRALWQLNAPLSTSFDPASREATQIYGKLMQKHSGKSDQYELASDEFVSLFGKESLALLGSSSERVVGQSATLGDQQILRNHGDLIGNVIASTGNPKSAAILFWANDTDADAKLTEYSSEIAAIQEGMSIPGTGGMPLTRPLTAQEIRDDIEQRVGWYEYGKLDEWRQSMFAQWGITGTGDARYASTGVRSKFIVGENELRKKYPAWDKDREFNRQGWYTQTGAAINAIITDSSWMESQSNTGNNLWFEVAQFMEMAQAYRYVYDNSTSDQAMGINRSNFESTYYQMLQQYSPAFGAFAARWLSNHPLLSTEFKDEVFG